MNENTSTVTSENTVLHALAKGVCPICSLVRAFQNELIERLQPNSASMLCNYHAWAIAAGAPASSATEVFFAMLRNTGSEKIREETDCDLCSSIREHEAVRLREFAHEMQRAKVAEWVAQHGTVCRAHGEMLRSMLREGDAQIIATVMKNNQQDLEELLQLFAEKMRSGGHGGGGILGRTAEFLVAQRGLRR